MAYSEQVNWRSDSNKCKKEYSCASCNEVRICSQNNGIWTEQIVFKCNSTSPYCDYTTGTCSSQPSVECAPTDSFICMRDGFFPDPTYCRKYHVCYNSTAYLYKCDSYNYYYYDSQTEKCTYGSSCYTLDCSGKNGIKISYANDDSIFAYCVTGSAYIVDKCPGNYQFVYSKQTCQPMCDSERLVPDVDDCTKYYRCSKGSSSTYTLTHEDCPQGSGFNAVYNRCAPLSSLPYCK